jgi:hypothetical protein
LRLDFPISLQLRFMSQWLSSGGAVEVFSIWFGAGFTVAFSLALGSICFGRVLKDWSERFVCGSAVLSLTVFGLCCFQLAYPAIFLAVGSLVLLFWLKSRRIPAVRLHKSANFLLLPFTAFFILYFFNSMAPEASPDGAAYHLGFVSRYLREHGFHSMTWNMYASLSQGIEMLFLIAFSFGKHSAAAMVHFVFMLALVWQMFVYASRSGFAVLGACAALLVFACPVVGKDGVSAYNDVALACVEFTLFSLLQRLDLAGVREACAIGLVAGFGFAIKYTGAVGIIYAVAYVLWRRRDVRFALTVAGCAALVSAPWLMKNWIWVQNPLAPFFNHWFPNPYVTSWFENDYRHYFKLYDLPSRWAIPWAVTVRGQLAGILGPVFLLSPLALLALRRREGRQLLLAAAVFGSTYFENIGARFLIPPLPFLALALMLGIGNRAAAMTLAGAHAALSWPTLIPRYAQEGVWRLHDIPIAYAMRFRPEADYLKSHLPGYAIDELIERATTPGATVLTYQAIPEAYTSRTVLVEYESAANHSAALTLWTGFLPQWMPTWRAGFSFPRQALRGIRVVQTANGNSQWRIHELRAFDGAAEIPRSEWTASAHPFPWGIERMLDENPVTFWECGDALSAGSYVEARFPSAVTIDSVVVETSPNQPELRLEVLGEIRAGNWKVLSSDPDIFTASAPDRRRAAVDELKRRGISYVLLFDNERGADAVRNGAAAAGMFPIGESNGARLYRLQ